jgi:DNA-directed RNA polymerase specialized sigma subunit
MKYDSLRKIERNKALVKYKAEHPELSYKEIGAVFNIDASRVWRIVKKYGDS